MKMLQLCNQLVLNEKVQHDFTEGKGDVLFGLRTSIYIQLYTVGLAKGKEFEAR